MPPYYEATLDHRSMTEILSTISSKVDQMDPESHCPSRTFLNNGINEITEDQKVKLGCDNTEKYKCMFCSKGFASNSNMKRHMRTHTGERPFSCSECDCKFSLKSTLLVHQRLHSGEKPFTCEICHKSFRSGPNLISHRKHHNDDRPYACEECGKRFVHKSHLAVHKSLHAEEKPFVCQHCDKRFSQASTLNRHSEVHKEREVFICDICGKQFFKEFSLQNHQKAHSGVKDFECKDCGRTFQLKNSLYRHKRQNEFSCGVVSPNRDGFKRARYECDVCLRVFKKKTLLRTHINAHLGEKPFECQECGKRFTVRRSLTHHLKLSCKGKLRSQENDGKLYLPSCMDPPLDGGVPPRSVSFQEVKMDLGNKCNARSEWNYIVSPQRTKSSLIEKVEKMTEQLSLDQNVYHKPGCLYGYSKAVSNSLLDINECVKRENNADYRDAGQVEASSSSLCKCQIEDQLKDEDINIKDEIEIVEEDIDERFN